MTARVYKTGKLFPVLALLFSFFLFFPAGLKGQDAVLEDIYSWNDELDDDAFLLENEGGLTITGTVETSQQMAVIGREEIEKHNAADLAELLQGALNLGFTRYGGYGNVANINLRGFDSKRVAVLVDGVPVNSATDGKIDIEQFDLHSVERIEVIYGGSDTKYNVSGALGGVINIITVKKQKEGLRLDASVSNTSTFPGEYRDRNGQTQSPHWEDLFGAQNYSLNAAYGGKSFSISAGTFANRAANHFNFTDSYNYTRRKDNNEVWDTGLNASLVWEFSNFSKLIYSPDFYYGDKNVPLSGFSRTAGNQRDISTRHNLMLDMPRAFNDDLAAEASLVYSFNDRLYTSPAGAESRHDQNSVMAINRWNWYPGQRLTLRSGFDYRYINLVSSEMGNHSRHDGGVYVTAEFKPSSSFTVIPSVKAVLTSGGEGRITPVPKLGFLFNIGDSQESIGSFTIKNNYFRSYKFPDFEELYWSGGEGYGNPDLKPEDGWGADLGVAWRFRKLLKLESTFFTQWIRDSIHWYSGYAGIWRPENVGEAMYLGLDTRINLEIPVSLGPIKKLNPSFSYQYLKSYLLSFGYDFSSDKRIPYQPAHTIGASLDIPWETGSLLVSAHYESLRYENRENTSRLMPHFLLNAAINKKIGKNFTVFAAFRNLLNESYESFYNYPMPGISLTLGLRTQIEVK